MLTKQINLAEKIFLHSAKLDNTKLNKSLNNLFHKYKSIDYADLYFQAINSENWYLEDNTVKSGSYYTSAGVGVRVINHDKTSLAFSEDLSLTAIQDSIEAACCIANSNHNNNNSNQKIKISKNQHYKHLNTTYKFSNNCSNIIANQLYASSDPLYSINDQQKIQLLQSINEYARSLDPKIQQVTASLLGSHEIILIASSDGTYIADLRPLIRLNVMVIAKQATKLEQGFAGGGGRFGGYQIFTDNNWALAHKYAKQAVHLAITNLSAIEAPAGNMQVVLGPGWPGILLHESIGHGLEGDAIRKQGSVFTEKLGTQVASNLCTIVDDGSLPDRRGSLNFDDEGTPTQTTTLIKDGILINYLQDKLNAKLMGTKSTGNGRRESYAYLPIPRMTNTYMLAGQSEPKDIIKKVHKGIYAANFAGGQVDITSGKFVFEANEAYLIENGEITLPVKGATLIGDGAQILHKIIMVGNDLKLDPGVGTCGKEGQNVPVGVGQPTLLIEELTVGGTNVG